MLIADIKRANSGMGNSKSFKAVVFLSSEVSIQDADLLKLEVGKINGSNPINPLKNYAFWSYFSIKSLEYLSNHPLVSWIEAPRPHSRLS